MNKISSISSAIEKKQTSKLSMFNEYGGMLKDLFAIKAHMGLDFSAVGDPNKLRELHEYNRIVLGDFLQSIALAGVCHRYSALFGDVKTLKEITPEIKDDDPDDRSYIFELNYYLEDATDEEIEDIDPIIALSLSWSYTGELSDDIMDDIRQSKIDAYKDIFNGQSKDEGDIPFYTNGFKVTQNPNVLVPVHGTLLQEAIDKLYKSTLRFGMPLGFYEEKDAYRFSAAYFTTVGPIVLDLTVLKPNYKIEIL